MAGPYLFDRILETSTTTGTGTLTLAGAVTGYQSFAAVGDGNTCLYALWGVDGSGVPTGEWETGVGTYTASGTTLARTTVLQSSNSNAAVNLSAGTKRVALSLPSAFPTRYLNPTAAFASLAAVQAGRIGFPSDGISLYRDTGSALVPWGPVFPLTNPNLQTFSFKTTQGTASVSTTNGQMYLSDVSNSSAYHIRFYGKTAPATPYTVKALFAVNMDPGVAGPIFAGLGWRQSSSGKMQCNMMESSGGTSYWQITKFSDLDTNSANYVQQQNNFSMGASPLWMKMTDNGTNLITSVGLDGLNWIQTQSISRTDYMTVTGPNEVGIMVSSYNADTGINLYSWAES